MCKQGSRERQVGEKMREALEVNLRDKERERVSICSA
ncbi:unnamed protein product [Arabidopsis thaliana]|uniref:Uncharacterized protein n=3 Tax=Arabidopsis TaxID=3701 RepID=A0A654F4J4_ARATH|nr:uncharacterized protein AT3G06019 [Arabidopsis thaliana]AEE74330.1 hypothetical protein AT3G06019 [Arabidopsis thaliana]KAG7630218.1 hypothetical protein ISN44_As03g005810 [Arabidopsis suecica]CAA0381500.1 unnamed protein product [Arabidopsis thaliana]VYS56464.1 unnamed protein product [Arabidopsis thaliana]|eukprot:NP_001118587.1 hypothetical protein AT3G06019 [Arabidopsis thaliana]